VKFKVGSNVRTLIGGRPQDVRVTYIYRNLDPVRFDAEVLVQTPDKDDFDYPGENQGNKVWGFASDILEVLKY